MSTVLVCPCHIKHFSVLYSSAFRDVKSYFSWHCHCCNKTGTGWTLQLQGVVAAVDDPLCIGVLQLWYSRLSFIPDPQINKLSGCCGLLQILLCWNGCDCSSVWEIAPVYARWCQSPARSWGAQPGLVDNGRINSSCCVLVHPVTRSDEWKPCPHDSHSTVP